MAKHVIELNGQKYDAKTGAPISHSTVSTASKKQPKMSSPKHLDGFSRRPGTTKLQPSASTHKQPERSKTLMRTVVKKPVTNKIHAKVAAPAAIPAVKREHHAITAAVKPGRAIRATNVGQSSLISKFGKVAPTIKTEVVPVAAAPTLMRHTAKAVAVKTNAAPVHVQSKQKVEKTDPFRAAIEQAVSHEQPKAKKPRVHHRIARKLHVSPRLVSFTGVMILALGVGGFLAYQNLPGIAMQVASTRSGLKASLPTYQPAGFSMAGPIEYQPGEVKLNYKSNSDDRTFDVTQKNSMWNSETLLENYVSPSKQPYQTFQANGRTIYIYEGNKATWVDGGVWYNIDGKTNLNSDQLLRIADSL